MSWQSQAGTPRVLLRQADIVNIPSRWACVPEIHEHFLLFRNRPCEDTPADVQRVVCACMRWTCWRCCDGGAACRTLPEDHLMQAKATPCIVWKGVFFTPVPEEEKMLRSPFPADAAQS